MVNNIFQTRDRYYFRRLIRSLIPARSYRNVISSNAAILQKFMDDNPRSCSSSPECDHEIWSKAGFYDLTAKSIRILLEIIARNRILFPHECCPDDYLLIFF